MGLGNGPEDRRKLGIVPTDSGPLLIQTHAVDKKINLVVDACATLRGRTCGTTFSHSPIAVARAALTDVCADLGPASKNAIIHWFFDVTASGTVAHVTPYRADLARLRSERSPVTQDEIRQVLTFFKRPTLQSLATVNPHTTAFLASSKIPWNLMYKTKESKTLAWRLLAAALRHAMIHLHAVGSGTRMVVRESDGTTVHNISADGTCKTTKEPYADVYGEADLQVWHKAVQLHGKGAAVLLITIDTDIILSFLTSCSQFDPVIPLMLRLGSSHKKSQYYNVHALREKYGETIPRRLSRAFLIACNKTDYTDPVTKAGFLKKHVVSIFTASRKPEDDIFTHQPGRGVVFNLKNTMALFLKFKPTESKYNPVEFVALLLKIMYVLEYYGLFWKTGSQPTGPDLPPDADSVDVKTFQRVFLPGEADSDGEICTEDGSAMVIA